MPVTNAYVLAFALASSGLAAGACASSAPVRPAPIATPARAPEALPTPLLALPAHALARFGAPALLRAETPGAIDWEAGRIVFDVEGRRAFAVADVASGERVARFVAPSGRLSHWLGIALAPDGHRLAICDRGDTAVLSEAAPELRSDAPDRNDRNDVVNAWRSPGMAPEGGCKPAWSLDGKRLALIHADRFQVFDLATDRLLAEHAHGLRYDSALDHSGEIVALADGASFQAIAGADLVRFDAASGALQQVPLDAPRAERWWLAADGRTGVAQYESELFLVDFRSGRLTPLPPPELPPELVAEGRRVVLRQAGAVSRDGSRLAIGARLLGNSRDHDREQIFVWDLAAHTLIAPTAESVPWLGGGRRLALSPDGARVASTGNQQVQVVDIRGGPGLGPAGLVSPGAALADVATGTAGRIVATVSAELGLVWDVATQRPLARFEVRPGYRFAAAAASPDGAEVAALEVDPRTRESVAVVFSSRSGERLRSAPLGGDRLAWLEGAADPSAFPTFAIAATRSGHTIRRWAGGVFVIAASGAAERGWGTDLAEPMLALSDDARFIAAASGDDLRIYDVDQGELARLDAHAGKVVGLAFTGDGRLVSGATDGTVIVWDVASFQRPSLGPRPLPTTLAPLARAFLDARTLDFELEVTDRRAPPAERSRRYAVRCSLSAPIPFPGLVAVSLGCEGVPASTHLDRSPAGIWGANRERLAHAGFPWVFHDLFTRYALELRFDGEAPASAREGHELTCVTRRAELDWTDEACFSETRGLETWTSSRPGESHVWRRHLPLRSP